MRVLAVAESDAYLKWAAWLLHRAPPTWSSDLCLVDSVISPSSRQIEAAVSGTGRTPSDVPMHGALALRRRIINGQPDILLLAATGRTVAAIAASLVGHRRPLIVAGIPGVALPVRDVAVRSRRAVDVFIAHSRRERDEFTAAFHAAGVSTTVAVAGLPFLTRQPMPPVDGTARPVFAAQPSVPAARDQRRELLERLAAIGPPAPIVKLRGDDGEMATHGEPYPYPQLWSEVVADGRAQRGELEFATGALADVLPEASCLITVSSTAALEAIDRGRPVLIIEDFGVDEDLLNEVFVGSGLLAPLTRDAVAHADGPRREWAEDNYFHPVEADDWIAVIERAAGEPSRTRPRRLFVGDPRSVAQGIKRLAAGRWRRRKRS